MFRGGLDVVKQRAKKVTQIVGWHELEVEVLVEVEVEVISR